MSLYSYIDQKFLFPIAEKFLKSNILREYRFLKLTEWWSRDKIERYRDEQLRKLINHVYLNVPYYTDLFNRLNLTPEDINGYSDLTKIPILTKQIIRDNIDKLLSIDANHRQTKLHSTGGSTGVPLQYRSDISSWNASWASTFRAWEGYGFHIGETIFTIGGHSLVTKVPLLNKKAIWDNVLMRNFKYSSSDMKNEDMKYFYNNFIKLSPIAIRGYASSLYIFALFIEKNKLEIPKIKCILTTGEVLLLQYKSKIQEVFRAPVYDNYGAGDGGIRASECVMHEGLHISEEFSIIEICRDDKRLPDGETGDVIATDLKNYTFPFIRYQVGDMAYIKPELCSCGRKTKLIGEVMGRTGKLIYSKDGTPISPTMMPILLYPNLDYNLERNQILYNKIDRYKFIQDESGNINILLKMKNNDDENFDLYSYIINNFQKTFPGSHITLKFVNEIKNLKSGKEDYVESSFILKE
jgi:phenylacetate-CoA ligase